MTCKDCIHCDVCNEHERPMLTIDNLYELMYQEGVEKSCKHFKNKADFVEVVRCKDCKHREARICDIAGNEILSCNYSGFAVKPTHYCSYGKRKEGAE